MVMEKFVYKIQYRDVDSEAHDVAEIRLEHGGKLRYRYCDAHPKIEFPGLVVTRDASDWAESRLDGTIWLRLPVKFREKREPQERREAFDEFVEKYGGRIVTDRFEFVSVGSVVGAAC